MRVLYLTEERISFSDPLVRGGAIHVRNVVTGLRNRGIETFLVDWSDAPEREYQHSVDPSMRFVIGGIETARRAVNVGRRRDIDVIVSKTRKTYLAGWLTARRLGVPHVVHVGSSLDRPTSGLMDRLSMLSFAARLRLSHDGYFVVAKYVARQLQNRGIDDDRVFDVKNAVDTDRFHPDKIPKSLDEELRHRLDDIDEDTFLLGFVGGLQPYKGLGDLAAAIDRVNANCHVVLAGDGPERQRLRRLFGDAATFLGPVPYDQMAALYHSFDTFILPSHTEGLPRVILEAQATATPVVATRVGGVPEVVTDGETGLLSDVRDPAGLAMAIERLHENPDERKRLGVSGRKSVEKAYGWSALYERYEQFLGKIVERKRGESTDTGRNTYATAYQDGEPPG